MWTPLAEEFLSAARFWFDQSNIYWWTNQHGSKTQEQQCYPMPRIKALLDSLCWQMWMKNLGVNIWLSDLNVTPEMPASIQKSPIQACCFDFLINMPPLTGRQDGSSTWVCGTHMGDQDWVLGFWLCPNLALRIVDICGMKQQTQDLCLHYYLSIV